MATSNPIKTSNDNIVYEIDVTETATSAANNTSTITVNVNAWSVKEGYTIDYEGECYLKIDGVSKTLSSWSRTQKPIVYGYANKVNIYTGTFTILHGVSGSKSIQVASCFELFFDGYVKLTSSFKSINVGLTSLDIAASELNAISTLNVVSGTTKLGVYAKVYNNVYTHTLILSDGSTTILTISNLTLSDGYNEYTLSSSDKSTINTYLLTAGKSSFVGTYTLTTYAGQTQVGNNYICKGVVETTVSNGTTVLSVRSTGITVNGDVNCTKLTQTTPNMEVNNGVLKILRW